MAQGRKTGGRVAGTPNKATADVRAIAQQYGAKAMKVLHDIMLGEDMPAAARVSAAKEVLERGYGKSPQPIEGGGDAQPEDVRKALVARLRA